MVLLIDDAQWLDEASAGLLAHPQAALPTGAAPLLTAEGQFEQALDFALRSTRLAPTFVDAYHVQATVLVSLGRCEDALHYVREAPQSALHRGPLAPDAVLSRPRRPACLRSPAGRGRLAGLTRGKDNGGLFFQ